MTDDSTRTNPFGLTLERYAFVLAHLRFFGVRATNELLVRFEIDSVRWASDSAAWSSAMAAEVEADDEATPLALRFATPYRDTLKQLRLEKPSIDSIGKAPVESEPTTVVAPATKISQLEELPERDPEKPSYLLNPTEVEAVAYPPVPEARLALEAVTLPTGDDPPPPSTPFTTAEPDESGFSLPQYAKLCAELVRSNDRVEVLTRHGLDKIKQAELDTHWRARMRGDRSMTTAFERAYNDQLRELDRRDSAARKKARGAREPVTLPVGFQVAKPPQPPPATPPLAASPKLSLERHAVLCAEIAMGLDLPENILARWSLSLAEKDADDAYYRARVRADRDVNQAWQTAFEAARMQILSHPGRPQ